jgi:hypothetical protein
MKQQIHSTLNAYFIRGTFCVLLLLGVSLTPSALAQQSATKQSMANLGRVTKGLMTVNNALSDTTILVTNTNDSGPGSLRDALAVANDGDTIDATGVSGTILLTSGELQVTRNNVTVNGPGAENLVINGNATSRVFNNFGLNVTIFGFTITNGGVGDGTGGGGIRNQGELTLRDSIVSNSNTVNGVNGGGIMNSPGSTLTVTDSTIKANHAYVGNGGGICTSNAQLTVLNSTISDNSAIVSVSNPISGIGGGIFCDGSGTVTVTNSIISGNSAQYGGAMSGNLYTGTTATVAVTGSTISGNFADFGTGRVGGGILNLSPMTVTDSTISNNFATTQGGGVANYSYLVVTNSTISGNSLDNGRGAGIYNSAGNLTVTNSTFSDNFAGFFYPGAGIYNDNDGTLQIGDTILNFPLSGYGTIYNYNGAVTSLGYNLASDDGSGLLTGPGDRTNTEPSLGPLRNNGGPTFTHALLPGSPAIDAGDPNFSSPASFDQRGPGFDRVFNGHIDIGSFEAQPRPTPAPRRPTPHPRP